jgi:hypothetical protein
MGKSIDAYTIPSLKKFARALLGFNKNPNKAMEARLNKLSNKKSIGRLILEAQKPKNISLNFSKLKI